jgi:hypothetical protein
MVEIEIGRVEYEWFDDRGVKYEMVEYERVEYKMFEV